MKIVKTKWVQFALILTSWSFSVNLIGETSRPNVDGHNSGGPRPTDASLSCLAGATLLLRACGAMEETGSYGHEGKCYKFGLKSLEARLTEPEVILAACQKGDKARGSYACFKAATVNNPVYEQIRSNCIKQIGDKAWTTIGYIKASNCFEENLRNLIHQSRQTR